MASIADPALAFTALERRIIRGLAIPADPEIPEGSAESVQVFRAGENYYTWLVIVWAAGAMFGGLWLLVVTVALSREIGRPTAAGEWLAAGGLSLAWLAWLAVTLIAFVSRRINFRLRWYVVTDRSLRIRSGVFAIKELTMTYRNVQEIRVTAGLLENAMGLATVEVHAAGGGGGNQKQRGGAGHVGKLEGLSNANEIRDLIVERLRQYRDAGLGDPMTASTAHGADLASLTAARTVLDEARAMRAALAASL